jgi:hypothetical protein
LIEQRPQIFTKEDNKEPRMASYRLISGVN